MYVRPTKANPRGYSLKPSTTEPYATCEPQPSGTPVCLSISPPRAAPLSYPGGGKQGSGWTPTELREAYRIPATGGAGQTIAIVIAYGDPHAESDLEVYRKEYGLSECTKLNGCFEQVNEKGEEGNYPPENAQWAGEASLDFDMASAMCPECHLRLVEAENLYVGENKAAEMIGKVGPTTEISDSWTVDINGEFPEETSEDAYFNHPGIPITAAAGDMASHRYYPAVSPGVIAVGGTVLNEAENARGWTEKVWGQSGGGCSLYESKPAWQTDWSCAKRMDNDVAADAELGISIYDKGWTSRGGTSAAAPIVAGILAHASGAVRKMGAEGFYRHELFDVTSGSTGTCENTYLCVAGLGYDGPTGWGTPNGPLEREAGFHAQTAEATAISETAATLHGYVEPSGAEATYHFEYGQTTVYGHDAPAPEISAGTGSTWKSVSQTLSGLEKDRRYHYRLVSTRGGETSYGPDRQFATNPWSVEAVQHPSGTTESTYKAYLYGSSCSSASACTGVGWYENSSHAHLGLVERWAGGSEWSIQSLPTPGGGKEVTVQGVSCPTATSCMAVGDYVLSGTEVVLSGQWNGSGWSIVPTPNPGGGLAARLEAISCVSASECIAVGYVKTGEQAFSTLTERWNGSAWSIVVSPNGGKPQNYLHGVSCPATSNCWTVGQSTPTTAEQIKALEEGKEIPVEALALHFDGKEWSKQSTPTTVNLLDVSCSAAEACTAVGGASTAIRWDGKEWTGEQMPSPVMPYETPGIGGGIELQGVSCSSAYQCIATGSLKRETETTTMTQVWNGVEWSVAGSTRPEGGKLYAVSCPSNTVCVSVGSDFNALAKTVPLAEQANLPPSAKPSVETLQASEITTRAARLSGAVDPEGVKTTYHFEYGREAGKYEHTTMQASAGFYRASSEVSQSITGLEPNTTYHFRITAENALGIATPGGDKTLTTAPLCKNGSEQCTWSLKSTLNPPVIRPEDTLEDVSCASSTVCLGIGYDGHDKESFAEVENGGSWEMAVETTPDTLKAVSCGSSTECVTIGTTPTGFPAAVKLTEFEGGFRWLLWGGSTPLTPAGATDVTLRDLSCTAGTTCTAVGYYRNEAKEYKLLVERLSGSTWTIQPAPAPSEGNGWHAMMSVSCSGSGFCLAVGQVAGKPFAERWNGSTWAVTASPPKVLAEGTLEKVSCSSSSFCMAVGHSNEAMGRHQTLAESWNGVEWKVLSTPPPPEALAADLYSVSCPAQSSCIAVGRRVTEDSNQLFYEPRAERSLAETWNGSEWAGATITDPGGTFFAPLRGVSCAASTACSAVGAVYPTPSNRGAESWTLGERWE
jgi:hypothetical protein